jgi:tight adherence protein C
VTGAGAWLVPVLAAVSAMLATFGSGLLLATALSRRARQQLERRFVRQVLGHAAGPERRADVRDSLTRLGRGWLALVTDTEVGRLLLQAGWRGRDALALFAALRVLLPLACALAGALGWVALAGGGLDLGLLLIGYAAFSTGYLGPRLLVQARAAARVRRLREEAMPFAHVLRVLYEVGLSTEQALHVLATSTAKVLPETSREVAEVVRLLAAGEGLAEATRDVITPLGVPELGDLFVLVRQIDRFGGTVKEPLLRYAALLEDRERTRLQESVSRLSAKFTMVMVLFLMPALLVFVGGPGYTAIIRALRGMHG